MNDIDLRLVNWGRYFADRFRKGHCYSIEHRYRTPKTPEITAQLADWLFSRGLMSSDEREKALEGRYKARWQAPDRQDAELIERAWTIVPSESSQALLRLFYVKQRPPWYIARRLKVDFERELLMAQASIICALNEIQTTAENKQNSLCLRAYKRVSVRARLSPALAAIG